MDIKNTLKYNNFFESLDDDGLDLLSKNAQKLMLSQKEILFHEGFEGAHFYILLKGSIHVFKTSPDGKESTIRILHDGDFFGEAILFGKKIYPATARATERSELIGIHKDSFMSLLQNEKWRDRFILALFEKLRYLTGQLHYLYSFDVEDRFFYYVLNNYGMRNIYTIPISKKDFASAIGTIPETFSRLLVRLTKRGILTWKKDTLRIKESFWEESDYIDSE